MAALAAAGRTNREVAQALHMSPKTVEANLGRIYDKLGIRSRAELGARMLERQKPPGPGQKIGNHPTLSLVGEGDDAWLPASELGHSRSTDALVGACARMTHSHRSAGGG